MSLYDSGLISVDDQEETGDDDLAIPDAFIFVGIACNLCTSAFCLAYLLRSNKHDKDTAKLWAISFAIFTVIIMMGIVIACVALGTSVLALFVFVLILLYSYVIHDLIQRTRDVHWGIVNVFIASIALFVGFIIYGSDIAKLAMLGQQRVFESI